jgi:two-component system, LuxR family, response regulator FixJ
MPETQPTVFVVDDDPAVRKSLEVLIRSVGLKAETYESAQVFLDAYDSDRTGCLVLDVRMPGMSGLELQKTLRERGNGLPVIIITGHGDVPIAVRAMKAGAVEFLEKPFSKQLLLEHIHEAIAQDARQRQEESKQSQIETRLTQLSPRERQVMELVVAGKVSKQIAAELGLSKKTVDVHRAHVMEKMQVESVAELTEQVVTARVLSKGEPE